MKMQPTIVKICAALVCICGAELLACNEDHTYVGHSQQAQLVAIQYNYSYRVLLEALVKQNEDLPAMCRSDLCRKNNTSHGRVGNFSWKETVVGYKQYQQCPFGPKKVPNIHRNDTRAFRNCILRGKNATWDDPVVDMCLPRAPITVQRIRDIVHSISNMPKEDITSTQLRDYIKKIRTIYAENANIPVLSDDVQYMALLMTQLTNYYKTNHLPVSLSLVYDILYICNHLLARPPSVYSNEDVSVVLGELIKVVEMLGIKNAPEPLQSVLWRDLYLSLRVTVSSQNELSSGYMYFKDERVGITLSQPHVQLTMNYSTPVNYNSTDRYKVIFLSMLNDKFKSNGSMYTKTFEFGTGLTLDRHLVYFSVTRLSDGQKLGMPKTIELVIPSDKNKSVCVEKPIHGLNLTDSSTPWAFCYKSEYIENTIRCQCSIFGILGLAIIPAVGLIGTVPPVAAWLRFRPSFGLYVTSHIARAFSLVCLLMTIFTYTFFRKTRRGTPTYILINLCVSLVFLLLVLYISEWLVTSKTGCSLANGLKLSFVLVSLLWNGAEAVNMYLMLVKVFNSEISYFTTKSAGIAWGVPFVLSVLIVLADHCAFDGSYVGCQYSCMLPKNTMYFGFLLPLGIIFMQNMIVFGLVLRVLIKHGHSFGRERRHSRFVQLIGAIAMLVLLGAPWILGVFGTIGWSNDATLEVVEFVMQVLFIVLVNLQGVFIFIFHCARLSEVRGEWKTLLTSSTSLSGSHRGTRPASKNVKLEVEDKQPITGATVTRL